MTITIKTVYILSLLLLVQGMTSMAADNPFFKPYGTPHETPPFDLIKTEHYPPAIKEGIRLHDAEIRAVAENSAPATFENTIEALDASGQFLQRVKDVFYSQLGASSDPEMEAAAREISPLLAAHNDDIAMNDKLFSRIRKVYGSRDGTNLSPDRLYLLENAYREYVRGGALLDKDQRARFRAINKELSLLSLKFQENVLKETNDSYIVIGDIERLGGLPPSVVAMGAETAKEMNMPGRWVYTAQRPSWVPFLTYSSDRRLREELYTAYFMRGDRDNDRDNKAVFQKIIALRCERAALLGYQSPADYYLENRMARSPEAVRSFLSSLWKPSVERAGGEVLEMQAIVDRENGGFKIEPWDWWYYAEKLRKEKYDLDDAELRPYFPLAGVSAGVFGLGEKLFGIRFKERKDIPLYHPDVKVYEVTEQDGRLLGVLYTDFFPRASKRAGAWSGGFRDAWHENGKRVAPLATIVCNFTEPSAGEPALLSMDEVTTFFHEFGHALNTLLFDGRYRGTYAPLDSVELPSQIMENWALEPELLNSYAKHYMTGETIPAALVEKLQRSRLFNQGFENTEYLAAAWLDLYWHSSGDPRNRNVTRFEQKVMAEIGIVPQILPRYRSTYFSHIIGGYSTGYYAYIWAAVLDADAFQAFKETSLFDKETAVSFRRNILEALGTEDTMTLYKRFRGKEPDIQPLLKRRGLSGTGS